MERLASLIENKQKPIIGIVILINIVALLSFFNFRFSTDYLSFFKGNHDMSIAYDGINQKYGGIESIQILIESDSKETVLIEKETLKEVSSYLVIPQFYRKKMK